MQRKIIHCDADCFYAAVEMRDNPEWRDVPLAIGGSSDRRGVIATCNYVARKYGVRSAMATATAKRLCPNLIVTPPNMNKYREASEVMRNVFTRYTSLVEPLSLDEAYLDVSESADFQGSATRIAENIRSEIHTKLGITVSAGVSNSKFLAKVASDWNKPNGLYVIPPEQVDAFVLNLAVNKIPGVGKVTAAQLNRRGIHTCADIRKLSLIQLEESFGKFGTRLHHLAKGIDNRPVSTSRERKSVSVENTYAQDLIDEEACLAKLDDLLLSLKARLTKLPSNSVIEKAFVKIKFSDFSQTTLERAGTKPTYEVYRTLMKDALARKSLPVRLLGIGTRLSPLPTSCWNQQLELF